MTSRVTLCETTAESSHIFGSDSRFWPKMAMKLAISQVSALVQNRNRNSVDLSI